MPKFVIRGPEPDDINFILSTWLRGFYYGNRFFSRHIEQNLFFAEYNEVVKQILTRPQVQVRVATLPDAPNIILGYAVFEDDALHWVFVKDAWRKLGIAKALIGGIKTMTHTTDLATQIALKRQWKFNPFKIIGVTNGQSKT